MVFVLDSNVLIELAENDEDVLDAIARIRERVRAVKFIVPPRVLVELLWLKENASEERIRNASACALASLLKWKFTPVTFVPMDIRLPRWENAFEGRGYCR
jgi:predicted nucleic acid-binding protein